MDKQLSKYQSLKKKAGLNQSFVYKKFFSSSCYPRFML